jgi:ankyrin repeat protein
VVCTVGGEEAADGQGPLHLAAQWGQEEVVTALIEHGADINRQDAEGRTPLHHAIQNGQQGIINMLLGCPGIHLSARYNNLEDLFLVQIFLQCFHKLFLSFLTTIIWVIEDIEMIACRFVDPDPHGSALI